MGRDYPRTRSRGARGMETLEFQARASRISRATRGALVLGLAMWGCTGKIGDWTDDPSRPAGSTGVGSGGVGSGGVGTTGSGGSTGGTSTGAGGGPNDVCT